MFSKSYAKLYFDKLFIKPAAYCLTPMSSNDFSLVIFFGNMANKYCGMMRMAVLEESMLLKEKFLPRVILASTDKDFYLVASSLGLVSTAPINLDDRFVPS